MGRKQEIYRSVLGSKLNYSFYRLFLQPKIPADLKSLVASMPSQIIVAYANSSFLTFFNNWWHTIKKHSLEEQVILFTDNPYHPIVKESGVTAYCWKTGVFGNKITSEAVAFSQQAWKEITITKLQIVDTLLRCNKNILFSDLDIVFLRNPFQYFKSANPDIDVFIQSDQDDLNDAKGLYSICSGFYYVKSNKRTRRLWSVRKLYRHLHTYPNDQVLLQNLLQHHAKVSTKILERNLFPNGYYWYNHPAINQSEAYIVHYNWLVEQKEKINKMKEYKHWFV